MAKRAIKIETNGSEEEVVKPQTKKSSKKEPKVKKPEVEETPVADEVVEEVVETVTEPVVETTEEVAEVKPVKKVEEKPKDKFEESKKIDADKSYDDVTKILKDSSLTNDQKLDKIYNTANVAYKALIDAFYEFDSKVYQNQTIRASSKLFNAERDKLWSAITKALETKDNYVRNAKIAILVLVYNKLKSRTLHHGYIALHGDGFADPTGFQEINFILHTLASFAAYLADRRFNVRKNINFKHPEFKYGKHFEEFFATLENR